MFGCTGIVITWFFRPGFYKFFNSSLGVEKKWYKDLKRLQEIKRKKKGGKEVSTIIPKLQQVVNSRWKSLWFFSWSF